jgi:transcriptional regulator with XRE-family HTH domain
VGVRFHKRLAILTESPLRRARCELGLTLAHVAARVGVTPAAVHRWELGQREHAGWLRENRPRKCSVPAIAIALPAGLDVESAQQACTAALADGWAR